MVDVDIVFLAGGPRPSLLESRTGWPLFRFPVDRNRSLLVAWKMMIENSLSRGGKWRPHSWSLLLSSGRASGIDFCLSGVEPFFEMRSHRGTGGALADHLCRTNGLAPLVLVIELSACPALQLEGLLVGWKASGSASPCCVIGESSLRRYCGVALFDRCLFEFVPAIGFFDLKEQLLPAVLKSGGVVKAVRVADRARRVRTRSEWLDVVQAWREFTLRSEMVDDFSLDCPEEEGERNVVSRTAVTAGATVVSSIVMDEAVVEPGALVARSVIGPGIRVPAGMRVIDTILADPAVGEALIRRSDLGVTASAATG